jgi:hypothetical protein
VLRRLPAGTTLDGDGRALRALLAAIAAWDDDVAGVVAWAGPDADWAWLDARLGRPAAGAAPARTRTLLAALGGGPEAAAHVAHALAGVAPSLPLPVRRRAAALGLAAVRRAFAARDGSDAGALEGAARAASALRALWRAAPAPAEVRPFAALLGAPESDQPTTRPEAVDSVLAAVRAAPGGDLARGRELDAWTAALLADALAAPRAPGAAEALDAAARLVARGFEEGIGGPDAPGRLGALLRTALPDGPPAEAALASHWAALLAHADVGARGELTLRALLAAARPGPDGAPRAGAFAEACAAAAAAGAALDDAALQRLGDAVGDAFAGVAADAPGASAALELALAALGTLVDGARAAALAQRAAARCQPALRDALRLRRLAAAVAEVERARDERTHAELCALLRGGTVPPRPADAMLLRLYLGVSDEPPLARARRGLRSLWDAVRRPAGPAGGGSA